MKEITLLLRTMPEVHGLICKSHNQSNVSSSMAFLELHSSLGIMYGLNGAPLYHPTGQDIAEQGRTQLAIPSCHFPQTLSLNSLADCKAQITQGLFAIGHLPLQKKEGIFNSPSLHCS